MKFGKISFILIIVLLIFMAKGVKSSKIDTLEKNITSNKMVTQEDKTIENNINKVANENNSEKEKINNKITNILLLGIDKEEKASDTIMIFSSNKEKDTIKLISIMRDTYVYQGEGMANKINYAYHYGGVDGSINTINEVFNLDINKYIKVTFDDLINIVDKLGGVEINITEEEKNYINRTKGIDKIKQSGNVVLNGKQALAYARIRKIDSDFYRTARQRKVMLAIFHKIKNMNIINYPKVISNLMDSVETNLSFNELLEIGDYILSLDENNLGDFRIPMDGTTSDNCSGVYHLDWDRDVNVQALHDYIYN